MDKILGADRCMTLPATAKWREAERVVGIAVNQCCHVCRKFLKRNGSVNYVQTCFYSSICKMPLCRENRIDLVAGRTMTFLKEHINSDETRFYCDDFIHCRNFPNKKWLIHTSEEVARNSMNDDEHACINCLL